jgi:hypothetical protein
VILKRFLNDSVGTVWAGVICLKTGTCSGALRTRQGTLGFHKIWRIFCIAKEWLALLDGVSSYKHLYFLQLLAAVREFGYCKRLLLFILYDTTTLCWGNYLFVHVRRKARNKFTSCPK